MLQGLNSENRVETDRWSVRADRSQGSDGFDQERIDQTFPPCQPRRHRFLPPRDPQGPSPILGAFWGDRRESDAAGRGRLLGGCFRAKSAARLFFLEARIVAGDAPFPRVGAMGVAFLLRREDLNYYPARQRCGGVHSADGFSVKVRQRRPHQIPDDQRERGGVAWPHVCCLAGAPPAADHVLRAHLARVGVASLCLPLVLTFRCP